MSRTVRIHPSHAMVRLPYRTLVQCQKCNVIDVDVPGNEARLSDPCIAGDIPSIGYRNGVGSRHKGIARALSLSEEWLRGWDHADADLTGYAIDASEPQLAPRKSAGERRINHRDRSREDNAIVVEPAPLDIGDRVTHPHYGDGTVQHLKPYLGVRFDRPASTIPADLGDAHHCVVFTGLCRDEVIRIPEPTPQPTCKLTGVGGVFVAYHSTRGGRRLFERDTWEVIAWFPIGESVETLRNRLTAVLKRWDGRPLPAEIEWGEDLAEHIGFLLPGCVRVQCNRPIEQTYAEWSLV